MKIIIFGLIVMKFPHQISLHALFLFLLLSNIFSQQYWLEVPSPTTKNLKKSLFFDNSYGWVIGDSGIILNTTNSGQNWLIQQAPAGSSQLRDLSFISRTTGWIISVDSTYKTFILNTTNSGVTWQKTYFPDTTVILNTIYFINQQTGFISGYNGKIYKTTNSGLNWLNSYIDTTSCLYLFPKKDIYFINQQTGFACGGVLDLQGIVVKTTNAGTSWFSYCVSPEPLNMIMDLGSGRIAAMGGDFDIGSNYAITGNNGINWVSGQTNCFGNAEAFAFRTPAEVWAALGFSGKFAVNLDSMKPGTRWVCIDSPGRIEIDDVEFLDDHTGFAFGQNGKIFKYNVNVIGVNNQNNNIPLENILYQNYPNPFNPETEIKFKLNSGGKVTLKIIDVNGKIVESFYSEYPSAGEYKYFFNGEGLSSGIYIYSLDINGNIYSKKMALIK